MFVFASTLINELNRSEMNSNECNLSIISGSFNHAVSMTGQLTPNSTVLLEKLTVAQLVKKFPAFY